VGLFNRIAVAARISQHGVIVLYIGFTLLSFPPTSGRLYACSAVLGTLGVEKLGGAFQPDRGRGKNFAARRHPSLHWLYAPLFSTDKCLPLCAFSSAGVRSVSIASRSRQEFRSTASSVFTSALRSSLFHRRVLASMRVQQCWGPGMGWNGWISKHHGVAARNSQSLRPNQPGQ